jgi:hypothetical protein
MGQRSENYAYTKPNSVTARNGSCLIDLLYSESSFRVPTYALACYSLAIALSVPHATRPSNRYNRSHNVHYPYAATTPPAHPSTRQYVVPSTCCSIDLTYTQRFFARSRSRVNASQLAPPPLFAPSTRQDHASTCPNLPPTQQIPLTNTPRMARYLRAMAMPGAPRLRPPPSTSAPT